MNAVVDRDEPFKWKSYITILWLFQVINYTAYVKILERNSLSGTDQAPESGFGFAVFYFIPCFAIWLTYALRPIVSRWPNIVFGALFTLIKAIAVITIIMGGFALPDGSFPGPLFFNEAWAAVAGAALIWNAWRYPK